MYPRSWISKQVVQGTPALNEPARADFAGCPSRLMPTARDIRSQGTYLHIFRKKVFLSQGV